MNCPKCGGKTGVVDGVRDCESVHRRRKCKECGHSFYTSEYESSSKEYNRVRLANNYKNL